jgi:hypothetical protein
MNLFRKLLALALCICFTNMASFAATANGYTVKYSGGSVGSANSGENLKLLLTDDIIHLREKKNSPDMLAIPASAVTEVSYGQEVHRRIGTAAGLAVVTLGVGAIVAFSKSKKHYIGLTWDDAGKKGGLVLQADKDEYRGLLTALEGITGKKAVDTDPPGK